MPRPWKEFFEQKPSPDDPEAMAQSIAELSQYTIARLYIDVKAKTATYTMDPIRDRYILADATGGAFTVKFPDATEADYIPYCVKRTNGGGNAVTVDTVAGNIDGGGSIAITTQYLSITAVSDGTNWWRIDKHF